MKGSSKRIVVWTVIAAAIAAGVAYSLRPRPVPVDFAVVARGPLVVTIDEEGVTRVRDVFVLSAPVSGRIRRIELTAGDHVEAGVTEVAQIEPIDPGFLDVRTEAQAQAAVRAAEAALALARAELSRSRADLEFAAADLARARELIKTAAISQRGLDEAERTHKIRQAAVQTAQAGLRVKEFELERARAETMPTSVARQKRGVCDCVPIVAPVSGDILRVLRESEGVVAAGAPLVEIGDPGDLEVVVDLLSADAVKAVAGQPVLIEDWGGAAALNGVVRRIEPYGFTKVSALGIEEQRVNVLIDIAERRETWARLGHGFRVEARIVLWRGDDVLKLPLSALFRDGAAWAVFVDDGGVARRRAVEIGHRTGLEAEIAGGLKEGERVVLHPSDRIADGVPIVARNAGKGE